MGVVGSFAPQEGQKAALRSLHTVPQDGQVRCTAALLLRRVSAALVTDAPTLCTLRSSEANAASGTFLQTMMPATLRMRMRTGAA